MADYDSLLLPVFYEMRRMGVPLGVPEYLLAVKTIREGVGVESPEALKQLCCLLWAKSQEDQDIFNTAFERLAEPHLHIVPERIEPPSVSTHLPRSAPLPQHTPPVEKNKKPKPKSEPVLEKREIRMAVRSVKLNLRPAEQYEIYQAKKYHLTPRLPIDMREMAGLWRHLRLIQRRGPLEELDVEGTINKICRVGFFTGPVLQPRRRNQARLLLLIDQQGSMAPFSLLIEALIESVLRGGLLGKASVYFFHDCPESFVYREPYLINPLPLEEVLVEHAKNSSVLIVSDAGAARGRYDGMRLADTKAFLKTARTYTYLYAWLNPVPAFRWVATTAEGIAGIVPMFHLDKEGLNDAIDVLRGHPFPPGVTMDV